MDYLMDFGDLQSMGDDLQSMDDDLFSTNDDLFTEFVNIDDLFFEPDGNDFSTMEQESHNLASASFDNIIGDPSSDLEHWHQQSYDDTCAVVSQEFILDELTGQDFSEDELRQEAIENGWYTPGGGTAMGDVGELLEAHGIDVERGNGFTVDDLRKQLEQGNKIIVGVDADEIWSSTPENEWLNDYACMPGQDANHAVQVIGIDYSNPDDPMVILNDPGHEYGQGMMIPLAQFEDAWADSGNFMVHTTGLSTDEMLSQSMSVNQLDNPMLGGYYNSDGTYHWESDSTDRDPETGAVVRRW